MPEGEPLPQQRGGRRDGGRADGGWRIVFCEMELAAPIPPPRYRQQAKHRAERMLPIGQYQNDPGASGLECRRAEMSRICASLAGLRARERTGTQAARRARAAERFS